MTISVTSEELVLIGELRAAGVSSASFLPDGSLSKVDLSPISDAERQEAVLERVARMSEDQRRAWDAMDDVSRREAEKAERDRITYGAS